MIIDLACIIKKCLYTNLLTEKHGSDIGSNYRGLIQYTMCNFATTIANHKDIFIYWINTLRPKQNRRHFPDDISKCIFLNENIWIWLRSHWSLFPRVQLTIFQHWFRSWLGTDQAISHYLKQWWLVYWRIYASLGFSELTDGKRKQYFRFSYWSYD